VRGLGENETKRTRTNQKAQLKNTKEKKEKKR
jgi:hypothetical protein